MFPSHDAPRVLVISSNPMRSDISNGLLMRSLFGGWPSSQLVQVYLPVGACYPPEDQICGEYRMINGLGRVITLQPDEPNHYSRKEEALARRRSMISRIKQMKSVYGAMRSFQDAWYHGGLHARIIEQEVKRTKPDLMYALLGNRYMTSIAMRAASRQGVPLFLHITDDWVQTIYEGVPFSQTLKRSSQHWFDRACQYASGAAGISPAMAEEMTRRTGRSWDWFTTSVDRSLYDPTPMDSDGVIRLMYAGNLGIGRAEMIARIAHELQSICTQENRQATIDVYTSSQQFESHRNALGDSPLIQFRGWATQEELPSHLQRADVLLHVESFDPEISELTKYSFSTKLNQYFMSGRCVLGVGPSKLASIRLIDESGAGGAATENDQIRAVLRRVIVDSSLRERAGKAARDWALKWGECVSERKRFKSAINDAIGEFRRRRPCPECGRMVA